MFETVNSLIEMALDFSEFEVRDPHDPELHLAMVGQRVAVYIPITTDQFWDVVENGIQTTGLHPGQDRFHANVFFTQREASDQARSFAYTKNNEHDGPIKPMILVAEKKVIKPLKAKDLMSELSFKVGAIKVQFIDAFIRPQDIVSVNYPAESTGWDIPIREFVRKAKYGQYEPEIPGKKVSGMKFGRATPPPWQYIILRRVQNMLNYSSNYYDYLVGEHANDLTTVVLREATKIGLPKMSNWTNREFMEWIYSILPQTNPDSETSKEDDIAQVMHSTEYEGGGLPMWRVYDKFTDEFSYDVRTGKMPAPSPRD
jgi:hypothetical protein